jgi:ABC-type uncharacterized transport system auxiliary subunit
MLCLGLLSACGAARPSTYYALTLARDAVPAANPTPHPVTLLLGRITSSELDRDGQIVYTSTGQVMGTYEYHRWAEPPSEMINNLLLRELRMSGHYRNVYLLRSDVSGDYVLSGTLYDLREVDGEALAARVAFEFDLRNIKTGVTVWSHYYSHDEPVNRRDMTAVVASMTGNVQSGLNEVLEGLDQYFSTHVPIRSTADTHISQ